MYICKKIKEYFEYMKDNQFPQKKRNYFLDFTKAFAIILVVFGHCIQYGSGEYYLKEELFFENIIFKYIYSFHMPLFMLISGYLFAFGTHKGAKKIIINKAKSLIIPVFTWCIIPVIIFYIKNDVSIISTIKYYIIHGINSLWFLWAVFWCSLTVIATNKIFKDKIIVYVLLFAVSFLIPDMFNTDMYKFMFPYFVIGYMYKKYELQAKFKTIYNSNYFVCAIGIIFVLLVCFFERESYIYVSKHSILGKDIVSQLSINLYRYATGLIGSIFTLSLLIKIYNFCDKKKLFNENNIILTIGKNTMGIYIISDIINKFVLNNITNSIARPNYFIIGIESVLVILVSMLFIKLIQRNRISNKFLLGAKG